MAIRRTVGSPANKIERAMLEMQQGILHSGSKQGPRVTNPKQAVAIGLHEQDKLAGTPAPIRRKPPLPFS